MLNGQSWPIMVHIGLLTSCVFDVFFCVWMMVLKYKIADYVKIQSPFEMLEWPCWSGEL